jgi:hypothetical protein
MSCCHAESKPKHLGRAYEQSHVSYDGQILRFAQNDKSSLWQGQCRELKDPLP